MDKIIQHTAHSLWKYKLLLLLAAAIWGLGTVVIKSTVDSFPPAWLVGVRFTGAGIILAIVMLPRIKKSLNLDHLAKGSILGALLFFSYWSNSTGLTDTTASNSSFLTSLYCVIIPFLGWALHGSRPTRFNIAAAFVCVAGVGCVSFAGAAGFSLRFGDLITLLSALFLSLHIIATTKFAPKHDITLLTIIQFIVAGLLGFAAGLTFEPIPDFGSLGLDTYASLAYLMVFASCVALLLQNIAVAHVDPAPASLFLATESVFGVTFSIIFLGEILTGSLFAGFALIFAGIVISEYLPLRAQKRNTRRKTEGLPGKSEELNSATASDDAATFGGSATHDRVATFGNATALDHTATPDSAAALGGSAAPDVAATPGNATALDHAATLDNAAAPGGSATFDNADDELGSPLAT